MMRKILYFFLSASLFCSCVPKKKFVELSEELDDCYKAKQAGVKTMAENKQTIATFEIIFKLHNNY